MATATSSIMSSHLRNHEDEKKYKKALRFIYKFGQETNKLTEEATEACRRQKINTEELVYKTAEDFAPNPKSNSGASPTSIKNRHQVELQESENNLALVRHKHHENRRKSKLVYFDRANSLIDFFGLQLSSSASTIIYA